MPKIDVASKVLHKQSSCKELHQPEIMHRIAAIGNHPKSPVSQQTVKTSRNDKRKTAFSVKSNSDVCKSDFSRHPVTSNITSMQPEQPQQSQLAQRQSSSSYRFSNKTFDTQSRKPNLSECPKLKLQLNNRILELRDLVVICKCKQQSVGNKDLKDISAHDIGLANKSQVSQQSRNQHSGIHQAQSTGLRRNGSIVIQAAPSNPKNTKQGQPKQRRQNGKENEVSTSNKVYKLIISEI